jgi:hypothetical protein
MKVVVLAEQLIYTDKQNIRADYVRGQTFEMDDEYTAQQIEAGNVKRAEVAAHVDPPVYQQKIKPAPAPKSAAVEG